jgi:peptidoglycan/xylan/chitin deacetylase (PgdA/CDA1 family)
LALKTLVRDTLIGAIAPLADSLYRERPRIRVLVFHDTPAALAGQLRERLLWLKSRAAIVTLADAFERRQLDPDRLNVALTFDDGLEEHYAVAAPLLDELGLSGTFFVPSGAVDLDGAAAAEYSATRLRRQKTFAFMSSTELRELAGNPSFEIGGHTVSHPDLATVDDPVAEVGASKRALEDLSEQPVRWFAYPFGSPSNVSVRAVEAIEQAGYLAAFTIVPSFWSRQADPYLLGRDALSATDSQGSWERFLRGGYDTLSALKYRETVAALRRARRQPLT